MLLGMENSSISLFIPPRYVLAAVTPLLLLSYPEPALLGSLNCVHQAFTIHVPFVGEINRQMWQQNLSVHCTLLSVQLWQ